MTPQLFTCWSWNQKFTLISNLIYLVVYLIYLLGHLILRKLKTRLLNSCQPLLLHHSKFRLETWESFLTLHSPVLTFSPACTCCCFSLKHVSRSGPLLPRHSQNLWLSLRWHPNSSSASTCLFCSSFHPTSRKICLKCKAFPSIYLLKTLNVFRKYSFMLFREERCVKLFIHLNFVRIELVGLNGEVTCLIIAYEQH